MAGPEAAPAGPPPAAPEPVRVRPGLAVLTLRTLVTEPVTSSSDEHTVLVNVGRPYRLAETLGPVARRTQGAPGDVAVVPAGVPMSVRSADGSPQPVESLVVALSPDLVAEVLDDAGAPSAADDLLPVLGARSPAVAQLASLVHDGLRDDSDLGRLALASLGSALAVAVVRDHSAARVAADRLDAGSGRGLSPAQVSRVLRYVEDDLTAPLSVPDLAARAHVSPFHFSRLFRAATGASPHQYVLRRRLARARELLLTTDLPVAAVAGACGFADQSHLTRHVRREFGLTPAALRTAARPG